MMGMTAIHVRCDCHDGLSAKDTKAVPDSVVQGSAVLVGPGLRGWGRLEVRVGS